MDELREAALVVSPDEAGTRLDAWLAARLGVPRARARRLVAQGAVRVDGRLASSSAKGAALVAGAHIEVSAPAEARAERPVLEPGAPLAILAEGAGFVVLDKPAGVPVHPLASGEHGTLLGALAARRPEVIGVGEGGLRSGVVHRLDVETSGAIVFATEAARFEALRAAFREHRVEKIYRAIVLGSLEGEGVVEVGLVVARHRPARVRVVDPRRDARGRGARRARLSWRAQERLGPATLVEVRLETGHLHQIRASFAHLGHPVAGDRLYGPPVEEDPTEAPRQMLHAARLRVDDVDAWSPDPPDLAGVLAKLQATR
ncbi:Ribosomal large subunit pseudouridine synthase D [Myxococcaceae bacterium]|jgi:23S rRNA pseudouridine1911/1915/1917 synthase|nr:Ribosomal large subunit pseudouridine synthase D [Myxococcaceae bacterium]